VGVEAKRGPGRNFGSEFIPLDAWLGALSFV
jgi:hypothetical protein